MQLSLVYHLFLPCLSSLSETKAKEWERDYSYILSLPLFSSYQTKKKNYISIFFHFFGGDQIAQRTHLTRLPWKQKDDSTNLAVVRACQIVIRMWLCWSMIAHSKCGLSQLLNEKMLTSEEKVVG